MRGIGITIGVALIRAYRVVLAWMPSGCRFEPTCSAYAEEAVRVHGAARGIWLAVRRLLHCHPFARAGFDPVPDRRPRQIEVS